MTTLRFGKVYFKDQYAGLLQEEPEGGTSFTYDKAFTTDLACALPRHQDVYLTSAGAAALHPFFEHLAPEGWLRTTQARRASLQNEDDLGLLLAYGRDCVGAVSVHADEYVTPRTDAGELDAIVSAVAPLRTISGIQPKLLAYEEDGVFYPATEDSHADYIAKFAPDELPDMVLNEDISLRALRHLLDPEQVTESSRRILSGIEKPALLVKRFDRTASGEKLRLEDFAQILAKPRGRKFDGKYQADFHDVAAQIRRFSAVPDLDVLRLYQRVLAFFLLGNCDCHLKNWSLLETAQGLRLSPAYDVVNSIPYARQQYSSEFGLTFDGVRVNWSAITGRFLKDFGVRLGLPERAIERLFTEAVKKKSAVLKVIDAAGAAGTAHEEFRNLYDQSVREAYERIET